jgi:hypothetical protein
MASDTANATVHVCPEGGELAGQVIGLLLVGMVLGAAIFSVPIAILLTRRDEKRREASAKEKQQLKKQNTMAAFAAMPSEASSDATPQRRNSESRRSRDDGREPRKYGTPEQIARRSISEAGAAGAWMTAPGDEDEEAPPAAAPAAAASSLMAIADDDARRFSLSNPLAA